MNLRDYLNQYGFKCDKRFGQNFLSDGNLLSSIADKGGVMPDTTILEIGCGVGTLTSVLCQKAKFVYGYEIDKRLTQLLQGMLEHFNCKNNKLIFRDIMRENTAEVEKMIGEPYMLVANIPYYITSPLIMKFIEESTLCTAIVVMIQQEVADRICSESGSAEYGAITAGINLVADSERLFNVPRTMFYPSPDVDSTVIKITFNRNKYPLVDRKIYRDTVRAAFSSRRKTLANNLSNWLSCDKKTAEELLSKSFIDVKARGETLSATQFVVLSTNIKERFFKGAE